MIPNNDVENKYSIIIPAYNEAGAIEAVVRDIHALPNGKIAEVIIVDDCSTDGTREKLTGQSVTLISNAQNSGYGFSLKCGIAAAREDHIIILDADGSYPVSELTNLMKEYEKGFDMVVGARQGSQYRGSFLKRIARYCFRVISEFATGRTIPDINSGFRIFRRDLTMSYFHTLSSGFSFTTTITLAYMLNSQSVYYVPITYHKRQGHSKVRYVRDTLRAAQIIVEAIVIYNPLKLFLLCAGGAFLAGIIGVMIIIAGAPIVGVIIFMTITSMIALFALGLVSTLLKFLYSKSR